MDFNQLCKGENIEYTKEKLPKYKIQNIGRKRKNVLTKI